jgi:hypothetical protein
MWAEVAMKLQASAREMRVMAWGKTIVAVLLAGVVVYSIVAGIPVDANLLKVILALLAAYFGFSAKLYYSGSGDGSGKGGGG